MRQETVTVVAAVNVAEKSLPLAALTGRSAALTQLFSAPGLGIHFARLTFIDGGRDLQRGSAQFVVLESNFDTAEKNQDLAQRAHLEQLVNACGPELLSVFKHCTDGTAAASSAALARYLCEHRVSATASYQGHTDRPLSRIALESHLREVVLTFFERQPRGEPDALFARVRAHVQQQQSVDPQLAGLDIDADAPAVPNPEIRSEALREGVRPWIKHAPVALRLVLNVPQMLAWDATDKTFDVRAQQEHWTPDDLRRFAAIAATEDHGVQNALTHVVPLRKGWGRETVLRTAHAYVDRVARGHFNKIGQLGGIPSIHFAKWFLLDGGKRLAFLSNYDSSWESYLGDFVDEAALGLNLAWSCTEEYPRTRLLAFGGADDEEPFKAWGRAHQLPTQVFYSAYPTLSVANINNNTWIRHGLHGAGPRDLAAWFRRLS